MRGTDAQRAGRTWHPYKAPPLMVAGMGRPPKSRAWAFGKAPVGGDARPRVTHGQGFSQLGMRFVA